MSSIRDKIEGDLYLRENSTLFGMVVGSVTVADGVNLQIHGKIVGDLILEPGSEVFIHGMLQGNIVNKGGLLSIFGTVSGTILREGGTTQINAAPKSPDTVSIQVTVTETLCPSPDSHPDGAN